MESKFVLEDKIWSSFILEKEFIVNKGIYLHSSKIYKGKTPYITAKAVENGVNLFINNNSLFSKDSITIEKVSLKAFYQPKAFYCSHDVSVISNNKLNKFNSLFITGIIIRNGVKYNYGRQAQMNVVKREKILLPTISEGSPDYEYMENYSKALFERKEKEYLTYIKKRLEELKNVKQPIPLEDKEWKTFFIENKFRIKSGRRLVKSEMKVGKIPFIGASDSNNGITMFIDNDNTSKDKNVLGVNYNGSVVENFYHPYTALFSDDVKRISFSEIEGNKYQYLFIKTLILQQKSKYEYGYKFNGERMKRQKIILPINSAGEPDYDYMEQYMQYKEITKLKEYLAFKHKQRS